MRIVDAVLSITIPKKFKKFTIIEKKILKNTTENIIYNINKHTPVGFTCDLHLGLSSTSIVWNNEELSMAGRV